jgi:D-glycero-beta-D-manno-heptose-7-phosphate kinase
MIDRYLHGKVTRISPEAPVPILETTHTENRLGGAANVALNIKAMGATPFIISMIGDDAEGEILLQLLKENDLDTNFISQSHNRKTTLKTRIMSGSQQMLRLDTESTHDLDTEETNKIILKFQDFLSKQKIDVIILQDYNKGVLTQSIIEKTTAEANKRKMPIAVEPKKKNFLTYKNTTLFKPNLKEIREALPFAVQPTLASLDNAHKYLNTQLNNQYTMITLSEKGMYIHDGTKGQIIPTEAQNIADVSGAGDTVISLASLCLPLHLPLTEIARIANKAGGQVCEVLGIVPVDAIKLKNDL